MLHNPSDDLAILPDWARKERPMASMLPYVSLVNDVTIRTRGNALFQCMRLDGVNSMTSDDAHLEKIRALFAAIIVQIGPEYSFYVHKVSKAIETALPPVREEGFAQALDSRWQMAMARAGLRDKTLTLTVLKRPPFGGRLRLKRADSLSQLKDQTAKQLRKLEEVVGCLLSSFAELNPRLLGAENGELLGFLGALNIGQERPLFAKSRFGIIAEDVANTRVTFHGRGFTLDDGTAGKRFGTSFAIKTYPAKTNCTMFDELNLPVDMVVTHSFTPINSNIMASRIKRQQRLMKASDDGAISLAEELVDALDELESKRLSFGDHHMTVTAFAETEEKLEAIAAEVRNIAASEGVNLVNESFAARTHYFAQHPGNGQMRSRKAAITNTNFADLAALHRGQLGKSAIKPRVLRHLSQGTIKLWPHALTLCQLLPRGFCTTLVYIARLLRRDPTLEFSGRLKAQPIAVRYLHHCLAKTVVVEVVTFLQKEELAILAAPVQNDMRVRVIPVLMHGRNVVKVATFALKVPLANLARDLGDILATRANRESHQQMRSVPELWVETLIPLR